jgi:hypothetical protein
MIRGSLVAVLSLAFAVGCGAAPPKQADTPNEFDNQSDNGSGSSTNTNSSSGDDSSATPGEDYSDGPLAPLLNGDPKRDQRLYQAAASAPTAKLDPLGTSSSDSVAKKIQAAAKKWAPGMSSEGSMFRATMNQGDHAQGDLELKSGMCYAVVGASDKVTDLDLHVFVPPGVLVAQDTTDDPTPVVGATPDPYCPDKDGTYKLDMFAERGAGAAGAQLYSKSK